MRPCRVLTKRTAPDLHDHDRFMSPSSRCQRRDEAGCFTNALCIKGNHVRVRVVNHPADHFTDRDIRLVARSNKERRAQASPTGKREEMRAEGSGLAGDTNPADRRKATL